MGRMITGSLFKRGKTWWLYYTVLGERRAMSLETGDRREAERKRRETVAPLQVEGEVGKKRALISALRDDEERLADLKEAVRPRLAITDAWERYLADPARPQSGQVTLDDYASRWERFAEWVKESRPDLKDLESITPDVAKQFAATLDGLSPNRYNKIVQTCRLVLKVLAPQCRNMANPFDALATKRLATTNHRELTVDELKKVGSAAKGEMRTLFAIGLYTALRLGDACTLRWDEVLMPRNVIARVPNKTRSRSGKVVHIPIHPELRAILEETPEGQRRGYVLPRMAQTYIDDKTKVSRWIQRHFTDCGITTQSQAVGQERAACLVGFHSLRHSFVSICAQAGVPLPVVQALCGHGSPAVQRHYIHLGQDTVQSAVNTLPAVEGLSGTARPAPEESLAEIRAALRRFAEEAPEEQIRSVWRGLAASMGGGTSKARETTGAHSHP